jgi:hypothetical protein
MPGVNGSKFYIRDLAAIVSDGTRVFAPGELSTLRTSTCQKCLCSGGCSPAIGIQAGVPECVVSAGLAAVCVDEAGRRPYTHAGKQFAQCLQCECAGPCGAGGTCTPRSPFCYDANGTYVVQGQLAACTSCPQLCVDCCSRSSSQLVQGMSVSQGNCLFCFFVFFFELICFPPFHQDLLAPLCALNSTDSRRFQCVDTLGLLPLPREQPVVTRCLAECVCNASDAHGLCTHHDVDFAGVPKFGEPWCTVLDHECLDVFNAPPIAVNGSFRGSCPTFNTLRFSIHQLAPTARDLTTGMPQYSVIDLGGVASRTLLLNPVVKPFVNGTQRNGTMNDVFLDYESCFFAASVPASVDRQRVCELLLAPRTTGPSTAGSAKIDFPLCNVSYGVFVNRNSFVTYIRLRSDNLDTFQIVYGTTGGGHQAGTAPPKQKTTKKTTKQQQKINKTNKQKTKTKTKQTQPKTTKNNNKNTAKQKHP